MSQYILISRLKVQNANAIAGFTWGFPAITHFLGFTHNLACKLAREQGFADIGLSRCAVIAHEHHVHTYGKYDAEFIQSRNPAYSKDDVTKIENGKAPSVIEEGKMNMTVSLLIGCEGNIGNRIDSFIDRLRRVCLTQRLAGGTITNSKLDIEIFSDEPSNLRLIKRKLLPGFVLMDRSAYLQEHYDLLCKANPEIELLDAWMDFSALKRRARPKSDLISKYLAALSKERADDQQITDLESVWHQHLKEPYSCDSILSTLHQYFSSLEPINSNKKLLQQWQNYAAPNDESDADWEYIPKPRPGYLIPIMAGYKAISPVYVHGEVENTRDNETPVCFVEAVHSVGEWKSVHRVKSMDDLDHCLWQYYHEENWYLCKQSLAAPPDSDLSAESASDAKSEYDFY